MVKRCYCIAQIFLMMLMCSCDTYGSKGGDTSNSLVKEIKNEESVGETNTPSKEKEVEHEKTNYLNDYFPYKDNQTVSFAGRLLDYSVEGNIILQFHKEMEGEKGELWKITMVEIDDSKKSKEELKTVLSVYGDLNYFFVKKNKIYWIEKEKISNAKKKKICSQAQLPEDADVVCQNKKKVVNRDGWHYRITMDEKNFITYSACFKLKQETSYLRNITFKKGVGIVKFSSQTTLAGAESIELWNDRFYHSEKYTEINRN